MANTAFNIPRVSAQEYLEMERDASCKHEFVDGIVYMMAGASRDHNTIALDIRGVLRAKLSRPCRPYASDVKVAIKTNETERYYYPDVVVTCSDIDNDRYIIRQPVLVVEVLSDRTEDFDRGEKFEAYKLLPSLQEYLLVRQDRPVAELHRRRTGWQMETHGKSDEISLESIQLKLAVAEFFQDLDFST